MREKGIWLFVHMELVVCRHGHNWLIRCYLCTIKNYPEEYCPPMPPTVLPEYIKNLKRISEMARNRISSHPLRIVVKINYPLPIQ